MQEHFSILVILLRPLRNLLYQAKQIDKVYDERINRKSSSGGRPREGEFRLLFLSFFSYQFLRILYIYPAKQFVKVHAKKGYVKTVEPSGAPRGGPFHLPCRCITLAAGEFFFQLSNRPIHF